VLTPRAQAICGFRWGFRVKAGRIVIDDPEPLPEAAWDTQLDLLRSSYRRWVFDAGYTRGY
jgi:hypothetical protein